MLKPEGANKPLQLPLPIKENTSTTAPLCSHATKQGNDEIQMDTKGTNNN